MENNCYIISIKNLKTIFDELLKEEIEDDKLLCDLMDKLEHEGIIQAVRVQGENAQAMDTSTEQSCGDCCCDCHKRAQPLGLH